MADRSLVKPVGRKRSAPAQSTEPLVVMDDHGAYARIACAGPGATIRSSGPDARVAVSGANPVVESAGIAARIAAAGHGSEIRSTGASPFVASAGQEPSISAAGRGARVAVARDGAVVNVGENAVVVLAEPPRRVRVGAGSVVAAVVGSKVVVGRDLEPERWYEIRRGKFVPVEG